MLFCRRTCIDIPLLLLWKENKHIRFEIWVFSMHSKFVSIYKKVFRCSINQCSFYIINSAQYEVRWHCVSVLRNIYSTRTTLAYVTSGVTSHFFTKYETLNSATYTKTGVSIQNSLGMIVGISSRCKNRYS